MYIFWNKKNNLKQFIAKSEILFGFFKIERGQKNLFSPFFWFNKLAK